jgi:hypothetical protein
VVTGKIPAENWTPVPQLLWRLSYFSYRRR